jgi:hypothetical protein
LAARRPLHVDHSLMAKRLTAEQRRALAMLANAGQSGCADAFMMAHGFTVDMLAGLVRAGLATATPQRMRAGGRMIEVARVRITDAGRRAVAN